MKKVLLFIALLCTLCASAQFKGGFGCGDPDAWFDKEIYFYCQNKLTYNGYGQNITKVYFIVYDGKHFKQYDLEEGEWWAYNDFLFITNDKHEFNKGDRVSLFWCGKYQGSWTCDESNPTAWDIAQRVWDEKPRSRSRLKLNLKSIFKKIR